MPEAVNVSWKEAVGFSSTLLVSLSRHKVWTLHTKVCLVSYHFLSRFWYIIYLFFLKKKKYGSLTHSYRNCSNE